MNTIENEVAQATWEDYVPDTVYLYDINPDENFNNHTDLLQQCLSSNSDCPLTSWLNDAIDFPEEFYLKDIERDMTCDGLKGEFDEHYDEIREMLWERDLSNPIRDLLRNTNPIPMFYSLGVTFGDMWCFGQYDEAAEEDDVKYMCELLGIDPKSEQAKTVKAIRTNASYGGELRIYFASELERMLNYDGQNDFQAIRFRGTFLVALHDRNNGSGWFEEIPLDLTLQFNRSNLFHAKCEKYHLFEVFGCSQDVIPETQPEMLTRAFESATAIQVSGQQAYLDQEAELNRVFKAGGCTAGDMDIKRHRDVKYRNDYPSGNLCSHCGTFWID